MVYTIPMLTSKEMQENDIIVDSRRLPDCLNKSVKKVSFIENSETVQPLQYTTMKEHLVYSK